VEGDWVEVDAVIGLIETMKVFNEVTADRAGRVAAFPVQSGQLVHAGDTLVTLEPADRSAASPEMPTP
jgi:acetyl-CoA carboxylase biotin carboxyl carrier protein